MPKHKYAQSHQWNKWPRLTGAWYIYGLYLEGEPEIRYVGSTVDPQYRFYQHINQKDKRTNKTKPWLEGNEERLRIVVFEIADEDRYGHERSLAIALAKNGHDILNIRKPRRLTKTERKAALHLYMDE